MLLRLRCTSALFPVFLLSGLMLMGCDGEDAKRKRSAKAHLVETTQASYQTMAIERTLPGTLQAQREVRIINQTEGLLTELFVYPGDMVEVGTTLATLDEALLKAELIKAQASRNQAQIDLKRLKDLAPRKLASESEIAQAQTQLDIARAEVKLKQAELAHTRITSPIDAVVSERHVESGDVLPRHTHILSLLDTSALKLEIHLSELLLPLVSIGNPVDIRIDALPGQVYTGSITRIFPSIDRNTRKGTIEISLSPVPEGALPGQLSRVTIKAASQTRLMIPYDAVRHDKQGSYVYSVKDGKALRSYITTGIQQDELIEVIDGLDENQRIVSKGFFGLKDGMTLKYVEKASQPEQVNQP